MPIDTSLDFVPINIAVITISDSRTKENDTSGDTLEKRITDSGHTMIKRTIIRDDVSKIKDTLDTMSKEEEIDCIITTCLLYTSPSPRDPKTSRMPSSA